MSEEEVVLNRECEFRFEVGGNQELKITLKSGSAEIFGVELAIDRQYCFSDQKLGVFTWYGCSLMTQGDCEVSYVSEETPMASYINIHATLEQRRREALNHQTLGPKVLVAGPVDSGKSTLTQILCNYSLRMGGKPTLVDLDVGQGCLSVPGAIAATPLDMTNLSVEEDFILTNPLAFFYGHASLSDNAELYRHYLTQLAAAVSQRITNDYEVGAAGVIINTSGWVDGLGYDLLLQSIEAFGVDVVLVIGQDRLFSRLSSAVSENVSVVKLARSGGVVPLNTKTRSSKRMSRIREYFYGPGSLSLATPVLSPCISEISFDDVDFYTIKDMKVSDVMLPVGETGEMDRLRVVPVEKSMALSHSIAAVCHSRHPLEQKVNEADRDALLSAPVAGFVCIKEVKEEERKLVLLVPSPGPLPSRSLLLGSIKWIE